MRNKIKQINEISSALSAIASGVLTDLICQQFSSTKFEMVAKDSKYIIETIDNFSFTNKLIITLLIFLLLWISIAFLFPKLFYIIDRFKMRNKPKYRKQEILKHYFELKDNILKTFMLINSSKEPKLYLYELFKYTNELDKMFDSIPTKVMKLAFKKRKFSSDIGYNISPYEFRLLITTIENNIYNLLSDGIPQEIEADYNFTIECIERLKNVI